MAKTETEKILLQCYNFFGVDPSDSIENVRKMYTYFKNYESNYRYFAIAEREDNIYEKECTNGPDCLSCIGLKRDHLGLSTLIRLMHDSYLAILLSRIDFETYEKIIYGLLSYYICSDAKVNRSVEMENLETEEYILTKEKYIGSLMERQHSSTNAGDYLFTPSLGSIIEIEKDILKEDEPVKCKRIKQEIAYGNLKLF